MSPPDPDPYNMPGRSPLDRPPFEPPGLPVPTDPLNNPWNPWNPGLGWLWALPIAAAGLVVSPGLAHAAGAGGGALPWAGPLQTLRTDLTGEAATSVALIAAFGVLGVLCFGGELHGFARTMCFLVFAISALVLLNNLLTGLGIAGASVNGSGDIWWLIAVSIGAGLMAAGATMFGLHVNRMLRRWRARRDSEDEVTL